MDFNSVQHIVASLDRAAYLIVGAVKETEQKRAEHIRQTVLLAGGMFGLVFSVFLLTLYLIVGGH